jgi:phage gp29-like protein
MMLDGGKEITIDEAGDEWGLYLPYGGNRPWADGLWRALKLYWIAGLLSFEDWNRYNEKLGIGAFVAKAPDRVKDDDPVIKKIAKELKKLGREKAFALPAGWILELIESQARSPDAFEKLIALSDTCKAITILGQNLTTEVKGGSFAATSAHKAVSADVLEFDARVIRKQKAKIIRPWAKFNYKSADAAPAAVLDTTPPEDDAARVAAWDKLGDATRKLLDDGFDPDMDRMAALVRLPQRGPAKARFPAAPSVPAPGSTGARFTGRRAMAMADGAQTTALERGRAYVDDLEAACCAHAAKELAPTVAAMVSAIEDSTSYDDAVQRIKAAYGDELPPSKMSRLVEAALILGQLAGRETVEQEFRTDE